MESERRWARRLPPAAVERLQRLLDDHLNVGAALRISGEETRTLCSEIARIRSQLDPAGEDLALRREYEAAQAELQQVQARRERLEGQRSNLAPRFMRGVEDLSPDGLLREHHAQPPKLPKGEAERGAVDACRECIGQLRADLARVRASKEARRTMQAEVDTLYEQFVATVAAGRPKLSSAAIRSTEARTFIGAEAIKAGLADEVGTFEGALAMLPGLRPSGRTGTTAAASAASTQEDTMAEADFYRGSTAGRAAERTRIAAILALPEAKGREAEAHRLALTTDTTPERAKAALASLTSAGALSPDELAAAMNKQLGRGRGPQVTGDTAAKVEQASKTGAPASMWDEIVAAVNLEVAARRGAGGTGDRTGMNDNAAPASRGDALSPQELAAAVNREAGSQRGRG